MTLPEHLARKAAPCNCVEAIRHACWACRTRPAIEAAIREAIEATVDLCIPNDSIRQAAALHRLLTEELPDGD